MSKSDDCASGIHNYCGPCSCLCHGVTLTPSQAQAIWKFLMYEWITPEDDELNAAVRGIGAYVRDYTMHKDVK